MPREISPLESLLGGNGSREGSRALRRALTMEDIHNLRLTSRTLALSPETQPQQQLATGIWDGIPPCTQVIRDEVCNRGPRNGFEVYECNEHGVPQVTCSHCRQHPSAADYWASPWVYQVFDVDRPDLTEIRSMVHNWTMPKLSQEGPNGPPYTFRTCYPCRERIVATKDTDPSLWCHCEESLSEDLARLRPHKCDECRVQLNLLSYCFRDVEYFYTSSADVFVRGPTGTMSFTNCPGCTRIRPGGGRVWPSQFRRPTGAIPIYQAQSNAMNVLSFRKAERIRNLHNAREYEWPFILWCKYCLRVKELVNSPSHPCC